MGADFCSPAYICENSEEDSVQVANVNENHIQEGPTVTPNPKNKIRIEPNSKCANKVQNQGGPHVTPKAERTILDGNNFKQNRDHTPSGGIDAQKLHIRHDVSFTAGGPHFTEFTPTAETSPPGNKIQSQEGPSITPKLKETPSRTTLDGHDMLQPDGVVESSEKIEVFAEQSEQSRETYEKSKSTQAENLKENQFYENTQLIERTPDKTEFMNRPHELFQVPTLPYSRKFVGQVDACVTGGNN